MKTQEEIRYICGDIIDSESVNPQYKQAVFEGAVLGYTKCQEDMAKDQTVTRFEVIDENGRVYVAKDCKVELSYQDDGRTLKVFIKNENKQ